MNDTFEQPDIVENDVKGLMSILRSDVIRHEHSIQFTHSTFTLTMNKRRQQSYIKAYNEFRRRSMFLGVHDVAIFVIVIQKTRKGGETTG